MLKLFMATLAVLDVWVLLERAENHDHLGMMISIVVFGSLCLGVI